MLASVPASRITRDRFAVASPTAAARPLLITSIGMKSTLAGPVASKEYDIVALERTGAPELQLLNASTAVPGPSTVPPGVTGR